MTDETTTAAAEPTEAEKIRAWGRENGYEVKDTGRLSGELKRAYAAANG